MSNTVYLDDTASEDIVRFFIWGIWRYYNTITREEPVVETPYLYNGTDDFLSHNGLIGISGSLKGAVIFSISPGQLKELAAYYQESEPANPQFLLDLTGEISNTISGNVRQFLGENFIISTPKTSNKHAVSDLGFTSDMTFVFPITWRSHRSFLLVSLIDPKNNLSILNA